jgi:parallel beta-helix repeat protein
VTVENFTILENEVHDCEFAGIVVEDGSVNVTVKNNIAYDNRENGIYIGNFDSDTISYNITVTGNTVYENNPGGIRLHETDGCAVDNNEIHNNTLNGIIVESGSHYINYNNITDCITGILVSEGNCTISHNEISNVEYANSVGTENNTISNNYLINNRKNGLRFYNSHLTEFGGSNNHIIQNVIANNSKWGLEFSANTDNNVVQGNYFFLNGETCQATDDGTNNLFDANYWDDWTTPDANNDSIVDVPYSIEGDAENNDLHPMTVPDRCIDPWFVPDSEYENETTTLTTPTGDSLEIDSFLLAGGLAVAIVLIVVVFVKRK